MKTTLYLWKTFWHVLSNRQNLQRQVLDFSFMGIKTMLLFISVFFFFLVLWVELRALNLPGRWSTS
jgi:hypothetical protein